MAGGLGRIKVCGMAVTAHGILVTILHIYAHGTDRRQYTGAVHSCNAFPGTGTERVYSIQRRSSEE